MGILDFIGKVWDFFDDEPDKKPSSPAALATLDNAFTRRALSRECLVIDVQHPRRMTSVDMADYDGIIDKHRQQATDRLVEIGQDRGLKIKGFRNKFDPWQRYTQSAEPQARAQASVHQSFVSGFAAIGLCLRHSITTDPDDERDLESTVIKLTFDSEASALVALKYLEDAVADYSDYSPNESMVCGIDGVHVYVTDYGLHEAGIHGYLKTQKGSSVDDESDE